MHARYIDPVCARPPEWEHAIESNVAAYDALSLGERRQLRTIIRLMIAEKSWEGCGGFVLEDIHKAIIAAQAAVLVLEFGIEAYSGVESILVYPGAIVRKRGIFAEPGPHQRDMATPVAGLAFQRGPVILAWDGTLSGAQDGKDGHNLVYHEFAHKLDMLDGAADGVPPLRDAKATDAWQLVFRREQTKLAEQLESGQQTFLDGYAAESPAEFFAVATEQFFEQPDDFHRQLPVMYALMAEFYRQDPLARERARQSNQSRAKPRVFHAGEAAKATHREGHRHLAHRIRDGLHPLTIREALILFLAVGAFAAAPIAARMLYPYRYNQVELRHLETKGPVVEQRKAPRNTRP